MIKYGNEECLTFWYAYILVIEFVITVILKYGVINVKKLYFDAV